MMLTLIREGFFDGDAKARELGLVDDSMVASFTSVSAPFRGTGVVYDLGEKREGAPAVRQLSVSNRWQYATLNVPDPPFDTIPRPETL